jgi:hypothetical protein
LKAFNNIKCIHTFYKRIYYFTCYGNLIYEAKQAVEAAATGGWVDLVLLADLAVEVVVQAVEVVA